jgi:hypothetical protein
MTDKVTKAKDAYDKEKYKSGQYSDKTYEIAKKQGALSNPGNIPAGSNKKDVATLRTIQAHRQSDLSKTAGRAQMIASKAKGTQAGHKVTDNSNHTRTVK